MNNSMFSRISAFALLAFFILGSVQESDAQVRLGTVKTETIVAAMPQFKQVEERVTALQTSYLDTLRALNQQYEQNLATYRQSSAGMAQADKSATEQQLVQLQQQLQQYQESRLGQSGYLMQYQQSLLAPVRQLVIDAIKAVAKAQNLTGVMEETTMIYVDPDLDITYKVLEYINKNNK